MAMNDTIWLRGTENATVTKGGVDYPVTTAGDTTLSLSFEGEVISGELGIAVDQWATMTGEVNFTIPQLIVSMELWGELLGNSAVAAGVTPNQTVTLDYKAGLCMGNFALKLVTTCVNNSSGYGVGDSPASNTFQFYNVMAIGKTIAIAQKSVMRVEGNYRAVADYATKKFMTQILKETA